MMSISPLKSAAGASQYYLKEEDPKDLPDMVLEPSGEREDGSSSSSQNYYLKEQSQGEHTFWHGKLAEEAGLLGKPVEQATLESVLSGQLGEETIKGKRSDHKSGLDLTFSAPKGVSILALAGGDSRLIDLHDNAVKYVLDEIEKDVAQVVAKNDKGEREFVNTDSMIFAVVRHKTSRENDVQVHSHALAANMTRDDEDKLRTLASTIKQKGGVINGSSERIYNFQKYYGALYHSKLAHDAELIGYQTHGVGNGQMDISGVPENLKDAFSTRSKQIEQSVLDLGYQSRASKDAAALDTRKAKTHQSDATLNTKWQQTVKANGYQPETLVTEAQKATKQEHDPNQVAKEAFGLAIAHLGQYNTALRLEKVIELAASDFTKGGVQANALDLKMVADHAIKSGELIPLETKGTFTTKQLLDTEKALIEVTQGRASNMRVRPERNVMQALSLSKENQNKVTHVYESTGQFQLINVAGHSQQIAESLLNVGNASGKRIHFISQTGKAAHDNNQKVTRKSPTFATWIKNLFTKDNRHTMTGFLSNTPSMTNKDVLIIDDAGKMSANELIELSLKAKISQTKVLFVNNVSKRQGFKAHSAIDVLSKGHVDTISWVNNRQSNSHLYLHKQNVQHIAEVYADTPNKAEVQVLATSKPEQKQLETAIRDQLKNEGQLARSGVSVSVDTQVPHYLSSSQKQIAQHYKAGMTLRTWKYKKPVDYLVIGSNPYSNTVQAMDKQTGDELTLNPQSASFKSANYQLFKPDRLDIAIGERLHSTASHFASGLKAHNQYVVSDIQGETITLTPHKGEPFTTSRQDLKDAPLHYDYVRMATHIDNKPHTIVSSKSYALSKQLTEELSLKSERVDIFTDNQEKANVLLNKNEVRPSSIERVVSAYQSTHDRYLSEVTTETLKSDITAAFDTVFKIQNRTTAEKAVEFALNHLSEREAGFTQKALVVEAVRYAFEVEGNAVTKNSIIDALNAHTDTLSAEYSDGTRWTTHAAIEMEKHILSNIDKGKDDAPAFATQRQITRYLDGKPRLTQGQKDAITLISRTEDRFVAVQGLAGTGKSTMLESNIELIRLSADALAASKAKPNRIIGLAPTHAAVGELEAKGVKAQTLESLLTDIRSGRQVPDNYHNTLFFLDESSMVSNEQAKEFTNLVLQSGSKATFLGDREQLLSLSAGKPFELAMNQGRIDTAYMTDIVRQQNKQTLGAVHNIVDKQPDSALDKLRQQAPDTNGITEHVISTLDPNQKNKRLAAQQATEMLPHRVAQDYLSRTPETRANTLIIAYTNQERDDITEPIREGRQTMKELGTENIITNRLRSTGASREELATMMPYQKGLVLSTKPGEYSVITHVDSEHGIVTIKDTDTGKEKPFLPMHREHKFTGLFSVSQKPLSTNDAIMTRFTDKARGIKANVEYTVTSATKQRITAIDADGQRLSIKPDDLKDGHWDYAYTRTADMAQGATYDHIITAIKGKGVLTDLRRAYIDFGRATTHVRLYTDNTKAMMKSWLSKEVNKASAIETADQIPPTIHTYFNDNPLPHEDIRYQNASGDFDWNKYKARIDTELPKYTESLAKHYLGKPNASKSDRDYLTFGTGKTALKVTLTGEYRGYFKDYTTGEKGSLINLIMSKESMSYKDAMAHANSMLDNPKDYQLEANLNHDKLTATKPKHIAQFEARAKQYQSESIAITDTPAEHYLTKLGIKDTNNPNVTYHGAVYSSETRSTHPAMVTNIHDSKGETKAVEITYLTYEGDINNELKVNPRLLGTKSKHHTDFHQGSDLHTSIITTSVSDAYQVRDNTGGQFDIVNVNHKNDIQNLSADELRQHVIIILSQGNTDLNQNNITKIMENLQGRHVDIIDSNNLERNIKECISKMDEKDRYSELDPEHRDDLNKDKEPQQTELDRQSRDIMLENESKSLEHFESSQSKSQHELDFDKQDHQHNDREERELEKELER